MLSFPFSWPSRVCFPNAARRLRDAEVDETRHTVDADEDVLRAHVPMNDPEELACLVACLVGGVKAVEDADEDEVASTVNGASETPRTQPLLRVRRGELDLAQRHDLDRHGLALIHV